jgi:transcriptional regulator with XRE-family HTH domain
METELKDRLLKLRLTQGLSQVEFSKRIGATSRAYSHYEKGESKAMDVFVNNICKAFLVNKEWLLTGEGEMIDLNADKIDNDGLLSDITQVLRQLSPDMLQTVLHMSKMLLDIQTIKEAKC